MAQVEQSKGISMVVPGPKLSKDHPDRDIHCQKAMETCFLEIMMWASASGWPEDEAATALANLAIDRLEDNNAVSSLSRIAQQVRIAKHQH